MIYQLFYVLAVLCWQQQHNNIYTKTAHKLLNYWHFTESIFCNIAN